MTPRHTVRAVELTSRYPHTHDSPVHLGDPGHIGIKDISKPDWGDAQEIADNEIPVFWAYGVTPKNSIRMSKPDICVTQTPGRMLITDLPSQLESRLEY